MIPFARPLIDKSDLDSVTDCLKSPQLAHGPLASKFEDSFVEYMGGGYATTTSSATTALQLAYMSLGIGPGDEVIVTSLTHVATANSIVSCGAKPVFVDINLQNGNIDTDAIEAAITTATKAICVVHYIGIPVEMNKVVSIAKRNSLSIIEDCALALGARISGTHVGLVGDFGVFSFYPAKHMTTGEGGMLVSKNKEFIEEAKKRKAFYYDKNVGERNIPGNYDIVGFGLNYRMSELSCSIGISQLKKIPGMFAKRRKNALILQDIITASLYGSLVSIPQTENAQSAHYCAVFLLEYAFSDKRETLIKHLNDMGIGTSIYYPVSLPQSKLFQSRPDLSRLIQDKNAQIFSKSNIALPIGPHLEPDDIEYLGHTVMTSLVEVLGK